MPLDLCVYFIAFSHMYAVVKFRLIAQNWTHRISVRSTALITTHIVLASNLLASDARIKKHPCRSCSNSILAVSFKQLL